MKKAFTLIVLIVTPAMAFAQGLVGFINNTAGYVMQWTSSTDPTLMRVPVGGGMVELLTAPVGTAFSALGTQAGPWFALSYSSLEAFLAANPGWQSVATVGFTTPAAGRFNGGTVTLPNVAGGANAEYVIIGWTGTAATFDQAMSIAGTVFGSSPMLTTTTGSAGTPPIPATLLSATFTGLWILPIPEPATFALIGLGAVALTIFRRRR
jgi:hypothetical protein